jgi:hypothetical protein
MAKKPMALSQANLREGEPTLHGAPVTAEPDAQLSVQLPASVTRSVKIRAATNGETLRATILRALKADGYDIPVEAITDRRAEANRRRSRE